MGPAAAIIVGFMLLAAYVALGIWATRATWVWSSAITVRWMRIVGTSTVATMFFMPGIVGAGHGVGIGPAWLMFATGTFGALTTTSKVKALVGIAIGWAVAILVGFVIAGFDKSNGRKGDDNPFR
jgi:hypothetical protein